MSATKIELDAAASQLATLGDPATESNHDLQIAALRYASAYYAHARALGWLADRSAPHSRVAVLHTSQNCRKAESFSMRARTVSSGNIELFAVHSVPVLTIEPADLDDAIAVLIAMR